MEYQVTIGLEVHAQILTRSKMFCACPADYAGAPPNTHVCPVCLGLPGALPTVNRAAVEKVILTALALNCRIPPQAKFDRKNYHYPDLMKGYQISQYDLPIGVEGWLEIEGEDGGTKRVRIRRVHLEEDTAKMIHGQGPDGRPVSLIDVNRSGVPLMEIVTEPDIASPEEAERFLRALRQLLRYLGVSSGDMEKGALRCDANISVHPVGVRPESKAEIKNMNSFRAVREALAYEVVRQRQVLEAGGRIVQETRGWREEERRTVSQRTKEEAHDYRYFPEPDLLTLEIDRAWVEEIRSRMPELPAARRARFEAEYGLPADLARILTEEPATADYFEAAVRAAQAPARKVANWVAGDLTYLLREAGRDFGDCPLPPQALAEVVTLLEKGEIAGPAAKKVLEIAFRTGKGPAQIVEEEGLRQVQDADVIAAAVRQALEENPKAVQDYLKGKKGAAQFLMGQVMRITRGKANPQQALQLVIEALEAMKEG